MPWKHAASLILAASERARVLLLRRSTKSSFFPDTHVFPGGVFDAADASTEWLGVLRDFGDAGADADAWLRRQRVEFVAESRASIFRETDAACRPLLPEVAFRICALRETFEECGLLLARDADGNRVFHDAGTDAFDLPRWQSAVKLDAAQFLSLFRSLRLSPDLPALHEWANWLTPSSGSPKRYDTVFFVCALPALPRVKLDAQEMSDYEWLTPTEAIVRFDAEPQFRMSPPTLYELAKVARFESLTELQRFAAARGRLGLELYFPVVAASASGCVLTLHPGDCRYPRSPDPEHRRRLDLGDADEATLYGEEPANRIVHISSDSRQLGVGKFRLLCRGFRPRFGFRPPLPSTPPAGRL